MSEYRIREFEPDDEEAFLSLNAAAMGGRTDHEWFAWKYLDNPYLEGVQILLVEHEDGTLAGARPIFPLRVSIGGEHHTALVLADTMVHPDHRRQGIFRRMTERTLDRYRDDGHAMIFNFPNYRSRPLYLDSDWRQVEEWTTYYRVADPGRVANSRSDRMIFRLAGLIAGPIASAYHALRERTATTVPSDDVTVRRETTPPVEELAALYRSNVPDEIHAVRDETFYAWRLDNPQWAYETYLAERDGEPVAAMITATAEHGGVITTRVADVVPLACDHLTGELAALLERILEDHDDTDLFGAPSGVVPESVLTDYGFLPDDAPPLNAIADVTIQVVRPFDDNWEIEGLSVADPDNWRTTFLEVDTG